MIHEPNEEELTRLVREAMGPNFGQFKPHVIYNEQLDWIEVLTADCSVCEIFVTDMLSLHERNHREGDESKYVGFHVECARRFCRSYGLPDTGKVRVSDILMRLSAVDETTSRAIRDVALPTLREFELDFVEFPTA